MKLGIVLFCIYLFASDFSVHAQQFEYTFLGSDFMFYKGCLLKIKGDHITGFSHSFYGNLENCKNPYDANVIYPDTKYRFNTLKDSLINRVFRVENIIDKTGSDWDGEKNGSYLDKPIFVRV